MAPCSLQVTRSDGKHVRAGSSTLMAPCGPRFVGGKWDPPPCASAVQVNALRGLYNSNMFATQGTPNHIARLHEPSRKTPEITVGDALFRHAAGIRVAHWALYQRSRWVMASHSLRACMPRMSAVLCVHAEDVRVGQGLPPITSRTTL